MSRKVLQKPMTEVWVNNCWICNSSLKDSHDRRGAPKKKCTDRKCSGDYFVCTRDGELDLADEGSPTNGVFCVVLP